jgi:rhamnosyltransferase
VTVCIHITAYRDALALARVLSCIAAQSRRPDIIRIVDNSPQPLPFSPPDIRVEYVHTPSNSGTAGAINSSIQACRQNGIDCLWVLDQDSQPSPELLAHLLDARAALPSATSTGAEIVAPLTRNHADGSINPPLGFDRYRAIKIHHQDQPVSCDFLPASGMLLYLPALKNMRLPSPDYFLDLYDFALGLAAKESGASVWLIPALELSHQIGTKVTFMTASGPRAFTDSPVFRVHLLHRNTTYLFTRAARGPYRLTAALWQLRRSILHAAQFIRYGFDRRWAKAIAAIGGWFLGLFCLRST